MSEHLRNRINQAINDKHFKGLCKIVKDNIVNNKTILEEEIDQIFEVSEIQNKINNDKFSSYDDDDYDLMLHFLNAFENENINLKDENRTILYAYVMFGSRDTVEKLINLGANINELGHDHGTYRETPLFFAAIYNNVDVVTLLHDCSVNLEYNYENSNMRIVDDVTSILEKFAKIQKGYTINNQIIKLITPNDEIIELITPSSRTRGGKRKSNKNKSRKRKRRNTRKNTN